MKYIYQILLIVLLINNLQAQVYTSPANFSFTNAGNNATFTTKYILVNSSTNLIAYLSTTNSFSAVAIGSYLMYAVNYDPFGTAPTLVVGTNLTAIGGSCVAKSASLAVTVNSSNINCGSNVSLTSTTNDYSSGTTTISSSNTIVATNGISSTAIVSFQANNNITLSPGFVVNPANGGYFTTIIAGCGATVSAITCASTTFSATATNGVAYSGTATVPYTGGNGLAYSAGTSIASTGVTGLTATLAAGTLASGAGNLTYNITGTPSAVGTAAFLITFGGQSCTFNLTISASTNLVTDNNPSIPSCSTAGTVAASSAANIVALRNAIVNFRNSLSTPQVTTIAKCLDDATSLGITYWHNTPSTGTARGAMRYGQFTTPQLDLFKTLLQAFLSTEGYQKVNEITVLAEGFLNNINSGMWNPAYYWVTLYGNPSSSGSWGFQLDGHHCAINFLVHGDIVSITPAFIACEPCAGTFNSTTFDIVKDERDLGLVLYNGMNSTELASAVTTASAGAMSVGPSSSPSVADPFGGTYSYAAYATGLQYTAMSATTKANLILVMKEYVYNLKTAFADTWWALIEANIDNTYFAWKDNVTTPNTTTQFYYRIYNPYLWIEYAMENPVGAGIATYNHAHTITRIPYNVNNGGDYGIFAMMKSAGPRIIQEHYDTDPDHQFGKIPRDINKFFDAVKSTENRFASFKKSKNKGIFD